MSRSTIISKRKTMAKEGLSWKIEEEFCWSLRTTMFDLKHADLLNEWYLGENSGQFPFDILVCLVTNLKSQLRSFSFVVNSTQKGTCQETLLEAGGEMYAFYMLAHFFGQQDGRKQLRWLFEFHDIGGAKARTNKVTTVQEALDHFTSHFQDQERSNLFQTCFEAVVNYKISKSLTGLVAFTLLYAEPCCAWSDEKFQKATRLIIKECASQGTSIHMHEILGLVESLRTLANLFPIGRQACPICKI